MTLRSLSGRTIALIAALALPAAGGAVAQHHNKHDERALEEDPRLAPGQIAPVLEGLGDHTLPITTSNERAQLFFDQGLKLTYGFNHQEALRAFKEAARLDPDCAMAYWGWALVLGPNLNLPMRPEVVPQAWEAIQMALEKKSKVSRKEQNYIEALSRRFTDDPEEDRAPLDQAYADLMRELHEKYPEDNDAATLYAAALMNLSPWNYWSKDGRPNKHTPEILTTLEEVIARDPQHEGALHYYIHAVEAVDAARGEAAADALTGLAPGAGHLVHMPSHIYMQTGRFDEAFEANTRASEADEGYITQCRAQGIYPLGYYPHNVHFLAWAAMLQGRGQEALAASRKVASKVPQDSDDHAEHDYWSLYQTFLTMPLYTMIRFGMWDQIAAEPQPHAKAVYLNGVWHFARGLGATHTGDRKGAGRELKAVQKFAGDPGAAELLIGTSTAATLLRIAGEILAGEMAAKDGDYAAALSHLERAVRLDDGLNYTEPPDWPLPPRHVLAAVLLEAGFADEATTVYWQDLAQSQENGYALFGLWQSLAAQGLEGEAAGIEERFRASWAAADIELQSSRF